MAKLSDRQKIKIKAKWDTGQYTKVALAKTYKVSDVMIGKIVGSEQPKNSHIVEAQLYIENVKKLEKSSTEIQAINQAVDNKIKEQLSIDNKRIKIDQTTDKILEKVNELLDKGKKQIVMKVKEYSKENGSSESLDVIDVDLDTSDFKNMQDTVDKASITNNTNQRHANSQVVVNNQNNLQQNATVELSEEDAMKKALELGVTLSALTDH